MATIDRGAVASVIEANVTEQNGFIVGEQVMQNNTGKIVNMCHKHDR